MITPILFCFLLGNPAAIEIPLDPVEVTENDLSRAVERKDLCEALTGKVPVSSFLGYDRE